MDDGRLSEREDEGCSRSDDALKKRQISRSQWKATSAFQMKSGFVSRNGWMVGGRKLRTVAKFGFKSRRLDWTLMIISDDSTNLFLMPSHSSAQQNSRMDL